MADHDRPGLRLLSQRCGILDSYWRADTHEQATTSSATRERLLAAMGLDASDEAAAYAALGQLEAAERGVALKPFQLVGCGDPVCIEVFVGGSGSASASYELHVAIQDEPRRVLQGEVSIVDGTAKIFDDALGRLPHGYYEIDVEIQVGNGSTLRAPQTLAVAPRRCTSVAERLGHRRGVGVCANLYTLSGAHDWGFGDFSVLRDLCRAVATNGGDFVGLNPLHARNDQDRNPSPYLPSSRLFLDPLYIDVTAVPELAGCHAARRALDDSTMVSRIAALREAATIEYGEVATAKHQLLEFLYADFVEQAAIAGTQRSLLFGEFLAREGDALLRFATHRVLEEHFERERQGRDWRRWPPQYRHPDGEAVARFRLEHARRIDYHCWLQFEAERQLRAAISDQDTMPGLGIYQDLAVGSAADGADAWAFQEDHVAGVTMGAPPDAFSESGQEWGVVPMLPLRMHRSGFAYWRGLLGRMMRNAGALRIDHVMGLERQFWVPQGVTPIEGAYVAYPSGDLFGILMLESLLHDVVVIGEDLGTVPDGFRERLVERGMLRSQVLYFERHGDGGFRRPHEYDADALVTANTHDLATLAGFWSGADLDVRRAAGHIADDEALARHRDERDYARGQLDALITEQTGVTARDPRALCESVARLLAAAPSALVGIALDDVAGETESINVPGTRPPARNNWTRRMHRSLGDLVDSGDLTNSLRAATAARQE